MEHITSKYKYRIVVAGGRDFNNYQRLKKCLDHMLQNLPKEQLCIISGTANGADKLGERYGLENDIEVFYFPADWKTHGKAAGHIRNAEMAKVGTHLVAFWDGSSKGTENMIKTSRSKQLKVKVYEY